MLERSREVAALGAAARRATRGEGSIALVSGEAGIGKSTVVRALRAALPAEARLLVGHCDSLSTPRTFGPFKDVAQALGREVTDVLASGHRDAVMTALHTALGAGVPTVVAIEDVHWADEATLDTLRFLARRVGGLPSLLVLTYRDELDREHPLTPLLGDLGHRDDVLRLPLARLSRAGVTKLAAGGRVDPDTVFALSDGNPYLATELIASSSEVGATPPTVVDGVLGRLRLLPASTQDVVEQLSVLPGAAGRALVDALLPGAWPELDRAEAKGLLSITGGTVAFRHELTRRAVADALSGSRRSELNRAALRVLETFARADVSQLVHHAVEAGDEDAVVRHGPVAARDASASGAHREAASHYRTVLGYEDRFPLDERARLWEAYAVELYTVGDSVRSAPAGERAVALWREVGTPSDVARSLRWLSRLLWFSVSPQGARRAAAEATAAARISDDESVLAMALSNEAQLAMLGDENARAIPLARQAIDIARRIGDKAVLSHALTNLGTTLFHLDDERATARAALEQAIEAALEIGDHEDACRAYVNLSWSLLDLGDVDGAEPIVRAGVEHAEKAEFVTFWQYLLAVTARVALARGRWDEATALRERITSETPPAWCVALTVGAAIAVRRGDPTAGELIRASWDLAVRVNELQRTVPVACVALEHTALTGSDPIVDAASLYESARTTDYRTRLGELAFRIGRHGDVNWASHGGTAGMPYPLMAAGRWREAAAVWRTLGWPYEEAEALASSPDVDDQLAALAILDRLGAVPLAQHVRRRLRGHGAVRVPRGPSVDSRADPAGLTRRQQAVLDLVAEGLTNAAIADRLVVSVRTVDSHVTAILEKLGVATRLEAAAVQRARQQPDGADLGRSARRSR